MGARIGIRVADGTFYPIFDGEQQGRRKLVVTTAQDNQTLIRIDFVREGDVSGATVGLGTLEFRGIDPAAKSDADIELLVGVDGGTLNVWARDTMTGEKHELSVSLAADDFDDFDLPDLGLEPDEGSATIKFAGDEAVDDDGKNAPVFESSDFELEEPAAERRVPAPPSGDDLTGDAYPMGAGDSRRGHLQRRRRGRALAAIVIVAAVIVLAVVAVFVIRALAVEASPVWIGTIAAWGDSVLGEREPGSQPSSSEPVPAAAPTQSAPEQTSATTSGTAPVPASTSATTSTGNSAASARAPADAEVGEVYTVRRGDTLWDLSGTYLRNPWLFPQLARRNNITDPDLILAGSQIIIPEL